MTPIKVKQALFQVFSFHLKKEYVIKSRIELNQWIDNDAA